MPDVPVPLVKALTSASSTVGVCHGLRDAKVVACSGMEDEGVSLSLLIEALRR